jgi:5-hydroxyisourate hydrolase
MNGISTHVLDAVRGKPAAGIAVRLEKQDDGVWISIARSETNEDGRCRDLIDGASAGIYRLTFETRSYLERGGRETIYPEIVLCFECSGEEHYHLPLLLSDNSYTTYRGS